MFKNIQKINVHSKSMYIVGNTEILSMPMISVSGTRNIDYNSRVWLQNKISQIRNHVIVSGLALGTDTIAHQSALDNNLPTIAVLPTGINNISPYRNIQLAKQIIKKGGAIISEYPHKKGIDSYRQYHERNKIIAKMGKLLIIPQFEEKSGTRSTVDSAQKLNKNIIVQNASYSGNQYIIKNNNYLTIVK